MKFVLVVNNIQMKETMFQIFDIGPSLYFMIKFTYDHIDVSIVDIIIYFIHYNL